MKRKINLGVIFGGRSAEHEVSIQSARNIIETLDRDKYELTLIGIDKDGQWYLNETSHFLLESQKPELYQLNKGGEARVLKPGSGGAQLMRSDNNGALPALDVVFPVLHGTYGEDGAIQGLLRMAGIPFVGSGILGSAVGMDKDIMKSLLLQAGIPTPEYVCYYRHQRSDVSLTAIHEKLGGFPYFVKPANMGSSVGIHKIKSEADFDAAIDDAFCYDRKILIEKGLNIREIECSVLGNEQPIVSVPGEIKVQTEFYSYDAKYIDENGAVLEIPANLPTELSQQIQALAIRAFQVLNTAGLARVDCFLTDDNQIYINEINTLPGFTRISMYPKLWEASGILYSDLLDRLIELAIERAQQEHELKTDYHLN